MLHLWCNVYGFVLLLDVTRGTLHALACDFADSSTKMLAPLFA